MEWERQKEQGPPRVSGTGCSQEEGLTRRGERSRKRGCLQKHDFSRSNRLTVKSVNQMCSSRTNYNGVGPYTVAFMSVMKHTLHILGYMLSHTHTHTHGHTYMHMYIPHMLGYMPCDPPLSLSQFHQALLFSNKSSLPLFCVSFHLITVACMNMGEGFLI